MAEHDDPHDLNGRPLLDWAEDRLCAGELEDLVAVEAAVVALSEVQAHLRGHDFELDAAEALDPLIEAYEHERQKLVDKAAGADLAKALADRVREAMATVARFATRATIVAGNGSDRDVDYTPLLKASVDLARNDKEKQ